MSSDDLWQVTQSHLERDGNAFWYLSPGQFVRKSNENWPLDPTRFVFGYVYQNEKRENIPLDTNALKHTTAISGTVKEEIRLRIIEGVEQGVGTEGITSSIEGFFTEQTSWRAVRMARSEVITGYAEGALAGYRQLGVVKMKPWLTAGGEKVDSEYALNEDHGPISLESPFASGVYALITHPNCHYVLQPVRGSND